MTITEADKNQGFCLTISSKANFKFLLFHLQFCAYLSNYYFFKPVHIFVTTSDYTVAP